MLARAYLKMMNDFTQLQPDLAALLHNHGLIPEVSGDWLMVDGLCPAIRAHNAGRLLYVELQLTSRRRVTELYPVRNGLRSFRDGVFPVLLSAFWHRHNPGLVTRKLIKRSDGPWQIFTGLYLRHVDEGERPPVPYLLFETIEAFLRQERFESDMHWLSIGVAVDEDGPSADIKLDGARQPILEARVRALDWIYDGRDYTLRNSVLLIKA